MTWLVWYGIFDQNETRVLATSVWVIWLAGLYHGYRKIQPDLFMLAGGCLSGIVILISLPIEYLFQDMSAASMLFLAVLVIGLGTGAAVWLRKVQEEWQS